LRFVVFIRDEASTEEFIGLARIDTEAEDEEAACDRAVTLHAEHSERPFDRGDVALCARLSPQIVMRSCWVSDERTKGRWDPFTLGELTAVAEGMEAAYFSFDKVDLPLWLDLLDAMDARGAGTDQLRDDLRWSAEEAWTRGRVKTRLTRGSRDGWGDDR
jgi:hypothetical protein